MAYESSSQSLLLYSHTLWLPPKSRQEAFLVYNSSGISST